MKRLARVLTLGMAFSLLALIVASCAPAPDPDVLYVNITWHQHQPLYYKDADGIYTRPWVRVHATKDYLDMAEKAAQYEDVKITFNFTPSLVRQLNDLAAGTRDSYWLLAEKPVDELTDVDKRFILERFFDVNWTNIIARFPRYQELLEKRGGFEAQDIEKSLETFTDQDFLDLQIWFNLAWFDPVYLEEEPLASLVMKGEGFTQEDKEVVFDRTMEILQAVLPYHAELQESGQIEITTTPYAHPILPLIYDNQLALVGNPSAEMPKMVFAYPQDAEAHLALSTEMYEETFGRDARGLWPGEGAVAQEIVPLVADAGYSFMQTGEPVLAKSLGIDSFSRDSRGFVQEPDLLYRPYYVSDESGNKVAIFFRDWNLSDKIGFVYTGMEGELAAADMVDHLEAIQADFVQKGIQGPHIVSIILDGENAWEHYPNDGNDFLNALYQKLSESEVLRTVTPSEYLAMFPEQRMLEDLFPGAWFSPNFDTWIGETEEAIAWDYLARVREDLVPYETGVKSAREEDLEKAFDFMYLAEGSDWFWWYGDDQDSGQDGYFDEGFRALLSGVYQSLGESVPAFVQVPIIQAQPIAASRSFSEPSTPEIDGQADPAWETAMYYEIAEDASITGLYTTVDQDNLYLRVDTKTPIDSKRLGFYFSIPGSDNGSSPFSRGSDQILGFNANMLVEWSDGEGVDIYKAHSEGWALVEEGVGEAVLGPDLMEVSIPLSKLGEFSAGDTLKLVLIVDPEGDHIPASGPAQVFIPDLGGTTVILEVQDPVGDDYGPGTYLYPTDTVFKDSVFDVEEFSVGYDAENLVFTFKFVGPVENPWGSATGLALQTLDVYIDTDPGEGTGARMLLPGRNAALVEGHGWEYAIWAEGWNPQVIQADPETLEARAYSEATGGMKIMVDIANHAVIIRVPLSFFPDEDPATWGYAAMVLGQEGYPSEGVWRVRDIQALPAQYRFGGGPVDVNHTRIIDLVLPEESELDQAAVLSDYVSSQAVIDTLGPEDFAQIPLFRP